MRTAEIRRRFLDFFVARDHMLVPSVPLPFADPNLLFVNAGMVPFVPYFLGHQTPPAPRLTSVQKCVRTLDIEEVGKTTRHGTFFQMNGNFAFGSYFKSEAISYAWQLLTGAVEDGCYGFNPDKIWVTVLGPGHHPNFPEGDREAIEMWMAVGVPAERIQERGLADNYWSMGIPGPGGPNSEIYIDRGPEFGPEGGPIVDEDRYLEVWNLVFMQEELSTVRSKVDFDVAGPLPRQQIDTGMGLERVAYLLQGVNNLYEIDEVFPVVQRAEELSGRRYGASAEDDVRFRTVADHVRTALMLLGDGVVPGNEGRGYVLRRLVRRAVRSMRLLGVTEPVMPELLPVSMGVMKESYPELERDFARISTVAFAEEEAFRRTLASGTNILDQAVAQAKTTGSTVLSGESAFQLHDTYGFPIDLTLEMASEHGLAVDADGFRRLMSEQRDRAKADARSKKLSHGSATVYKQVADELGRQVEFTGYTEMESHGSVLSMVRGGELVERANPGDLVDIVLDRTPFYAEKGGQQADWGRITTADGAELEVVDVQSPIPGLVVHSARLVDGELRTGALATALVDSDRRRSISRAHTATHILHKALREALGDTATQAGSENSPGRLRFDFRSTAGVDASTLASIEQRVNERLMDGLEVGATEMPLAEARDLGAMALFGERYPDVVRVVSVGGPWSLELCGGTHAPNSAQLGLVKIMGEASIGAGVRRVEALVGADAYQHLAREHVIVNQLADMMQARSTDLPERMALLMSRLKEAERELSALRAAQLSAGVGSLVAGAELVGATRLISSHLPGEVTADDLRSVATEARARLGDADPVVVALAGVSAGRPLVVVATNQEARSRGLQAGALVKVACQVLGGGGGGKPELAQGGGQDAGAVPAALSAVRRVVEAAS